MITCNLQGRMGNQMFQIAAVIGLAEKHGIPYSIPKQTMSPETWPAYFSHLQELPLQGKLLNHLEQVFEYTPIPAPPKGRYLILNGYYQTEKYFEHCREKVREAFNFSHQMRKGWVSIHVRRGDYLQYSNLFPVMTIDYYRRSINFFRSYGYNKFLVASDDMPWCKENLNSAKIPCSLFEYSEGNEHEDMQRLSCCEHNLGSNSSFSWWIGWLNQNPDKIVTMPTYLFENSNKDMIPESWIRINN